VEGNAPSFPSNDKCQAISGQRVMWICGNGGALPSSERGEAQAIKAITSVRQSADSVPCGSAAMEAQCPAVRRERPN